MIAGRRDGIEVPENVLQLVRKEMKLNNAKELARVAGLHRTTLYKIMRGRASVGTMQKLNAAFDAGLAITVLITSTQNTCDSN